MIKKKTKQTRGAFYLNYMQDKEVSDAWSLEQHHNVKQHTACLQLGSEQTKRCSSFDTYAVTPERVENQSREEMRSEGKVRKKCKEHKLYTFPLCVQRGRQAGNLKEREIEKKVKKWVKV